MPVDWPPDAAIVVLSYGAGPVAGLVTSLAAEGVPGSRVFVVHNPGPGGRRCPDLGVEAVVLDRPSNDGYGAAMNEGILAARQAGADFAVLCTHDARVSSQVARSLVETLRWTPTIAAAGPVLSDEDGVFSAGGRVRLGRPSHVAPTGADMKSVDWLDGSVLAVRLDLPRYFREDFFLYWEDIDFARNLRRRGYDVVCVQSLGAFSTPGNRHGRSNLYTFLRFRNALLAAREDRAWTEMLAISALLVVKAIRSLSAVTGGGGRTTAALLFRALADGWQGRLGRPQASVLAGSDAV